MQYSAHAPNRYILTHQDRLLPDWSLPVRSVLLVFQPSKCDLLRKSLASEASKNKLRLQFLSFALPVAEYLLLLGHSVELFDPRTGLPLLSSDGSLRLDDVAIAHALLGYPVYSYGGCSVVQHPTWGRAVYPSTLVSSAPPSLLQQIADDITRYSTASDFAGLCEYHHSLTG